MEIRVNIPKCILTVVNQLYELEQKLKKSGHLAGFGRNISKMKDAFSEEGLPDTGGGRIRLVIEDPMGQSFNETRTDMEATIAGPSPDNLVVVEVIKPIIRAFVRDGVSLIVQKGIVIVESRKEPVPHE
jgi:hypothetical protein